MTFDEWLEENFRTEKLLEEHVELMRLAWNSNQVHNIHKPKNAVKVDTNCNLSYLLRDYLK
jgi:hypothetical protein